MALISESTIRSLAQEKVKTTARSMLLEGKATDYQRFDVFVSHSSGEPEEIILGTKLALEAVGLSVYVDRYSDPQLSPAAVTTATAELLRRRMRQSKSLIYIYSHHSRESRWMPWELGYFDAFLGTVGIFPVVRDDDAKFEREEYLSLYPYVDGNPLCKMWMNRDSSNYVELTEWVNQRKQV